MEISPGLTIVIYFGTKINFRIITYVYLLAKIQSLRTFYREELRKVKKSQGTGSGSSDVYVSKWKFFDECSFLDEVISSIDLHAVTL